MHDNEDATDPQPGSTAHLLQEMQLFGYRPFEDEPDHRPLPDARIVAGAIADIFDALVSCLSDTRIEPDLEDLAWSTVHVFHRAAERIERELDANEQLQRRLQRDQDGSEVMSVELERATALGISMIERRDTMEFFRDAAADQFRLHLRKAWLPRSGAMVNHAKLTAAVIDSRRQIDKRAYEDARLLNPDAPRIVLSCGADYNDGAALYGLLDKVLGRFPAMILMHGATPTGGERIAACWARDRGVAQEPHRPDWNRHRKAAPFKRNDAMLEKLPVAVIVLPGTGIQDNLADKARKMGIRLWDLRKGRADRLCQPQSKPFKSLSLKTANVQERPGAISAEARPQFSATGSIVTIRLGDRGGQALVRVVDGSRAIPFKFSRAALLVQPACRCQCWDQYQGIACTALGWRSPKTSPTAWALRSAPTRVRRGQPSISPPVVAATPF